MLKIDATAFDGCVYECDDMDQHAQVLQGLCSQAGAIGQALIIHTNVYRPESDDTATRIVDSVDA